MSKPKQKPDAQSSSSGATPIKAASPRKDATQSVSTPNPMVWLWVALLAAWVLIAYLRALDNQFVDWDDPTYVTENPYLQPANQENLHVLLRSVVSLNYHPLTMATLWWNAANSGIESARAYIWFNLIFHIFNTGLVFFFAFLLSKRNVLILSLIHI